MTLLNRFKNSYEQPEFVILDLKTSGPDPVRDGVVEVATLRVSNGEILDSFWSSLNPSPLEPNPSWGPSNILGQEVLVHPSFGQVSSKLRAFIGASTLVGQNISLASKFFAARGLTISSPLIDIHEFTSMLLPGIGGDLEEFADYYGLTYSGSNSCFTNSHTVFQVFSELIEDTIRMPPEVRGEMFRIANISGLSIRHLLPLLPKGIYERSNEINESNSVGGLNQQKLDKRISGGRPLEKRNSPIKPIPEKNLVDMFSPGGILESALDGYESRAQQQEMFHAIAASFYQGRHLIVEAGTGVGKSLAYLLPAAMFALKNNARVLVSTNTINLQQQLIEKDLPSVEKALEIAGYENYSDLRYSVQKGRSNYLCYKRWARLRSDPNPSIQDGHFLGKTLIWMQHNVTGDRADIYLDASESLIWEKTSAQGSLDCPIFSGPCFLRASRERAEGSHILVVNHALMLSDLKHNGTLLPDYDYLIVDEAHHLEDEVTRQFGLSVTQRQLADIFDKIIGPRGLIEESLDISRILMISGSRRESIESARQNLAEHVKLSWTATQALFSRIADFMKEEKQSGVDLHSQILITSDTRRRSDWGKITLFGEKTSLNLSGVIQDFSRLQISLESLGSNNMSYAEELCSELISLSEEIIQIKEVLGQILLYPDDQMVYWFEELETDSISIHAAPLNIGTILRDHLFQVKNSVILTSATLGARGEFISVHQNLGLDNADELVLDSPFDYKRSALLCLPETIPEPGTEGYNSCLAKTIENVVNVASGHTMVLFTSYASLRTTNLAVRDSLAANEIKVLAQGIDGTPQQILKEFLKNPKALLMGTASFWEGIDLAGEALKVLILARLPFNVPTEPVFAARSQLFDNPFREYALPQAIIRFRQGFGRLIRTKNDRGVVVVLDQRIASRSYGKEFIRSIPECTILRPDLTELPGLITDWLSQ